MASNPDINTTIDLGLPSVPTIKNPPELYAELLTIYNAIRAIAIGVDDYTLSGDLLDQIAEIQAALPVAIAVFKRGLKALRQDMEELPNVHASHYELRKQYYRYTVPKFTVNTNLNVKQKFSLGDPATFPPVGIQAITKAPGTAPAGGVGTAAGGFDTAANRDAAISAINANKAAILEIQQILNKFGLAQ